MATGKISPFIFSEIFYEIGFFTEGQTLFSLIEFHVAISFKNNYSSHLEFLNWTLL
jgi:hypothetical protein